DTIKACHKHGIGVTAYFNAGISVANLIDHPEWRKVDKDGKSTRPHYSPYDDCGLIYRGCFNTGYYDFLKSVIREVVDNYDVDGIFCDCFNHEPCYCDNCKKDMIALGIDLDDYKQTLAFNDKKLHEFCYDIRKMVAPRHTFFNSMDWDLDFEDHIEHECLPNTTLWSYEFFSPYAAFARSCGKEMTYMTGRFSNCWGDFGGIVPKASLENDMYDAISNGFGFCVGDHAHPAYGLIPSLYKNIGDIFEQLTRYEKYTEDAEYVAEIGIISDIPSYDMQNYNGLCRILSELKYDYNIIRKTVDFEKYKLLILPENTLLSEDVALKIETFIKNGGKVISCGKGGLNLSETDFALEAYRKALSFNGLDNRNSSFYVFDDSVQTDKKGVIWSTYKPSICMKSKTGKAIAADIGLYFDKHCDGERNFFYVPPRKPTGNDAVVLTENFAHVAFDVFEGYEKCFLETHRELVRILLEALIAKPLIKANTMPVSSRITVTKTATHTNLNVKVTYPESKGQIGVVNEHTYLPKGHEIFIKGNYVRAIEALSGKAIPIQLCEDYTKIVLPEIKGFM
ncbi:MAG: beta-galactosidase trimerization domain-containing protein, partial [Clostridia bacterium]|nr:beta-galactosidase trimerization domain-containing protein [Clostridia bacterium]